LLEMDFQTSVPNPASAAPPDSPAASPTPAVARAHKSLPGDSLPPAVVPGPGGKLQLKGLSLPELKELFRTWGEPEYRAVQVMEWMYQRAARSFGDMTNLPKGLRQRLEETCSIEAVSPETRQVASDGTTKYLFGLADGHAVETVLMPHDYGNSVCVTSQVGCRMGCVFCASTLGGVARNCSVGEMVDQVVFVQRELAAKGEHVSSVVLMGSGEPLENYEAVVAFIRLLGDPRGLGIGLRHITLSTCGIVPGIRRLAAEDLPITLAVSLHAPTDELRSRMVPVNRRFALAELLEAGRDYASQTRRRLTFEYILIKDLNDSLEDARTLAHLMKGQLAHVNLIPANPVPERGVERTPQAQVEAFARILEERGVPVTVRREMGTDIDAACGQLRRRRGRDR